MRLAYRPETAADEFFLRTLMLETLAEQLAVWSWPEQLRVPLLETQSRYNARAFAAVVTRA